MAKQAQPFTPMSDFMPNSKQKWETEPLTLLLWCANHRPTASSNKCVHDNECDKYRAMIWHSYRLVCWLLESRHFLRSWRFYGPETCLLLPTDLHGGWSPGRWSTAQTQHGENLKICFMHIDVSHRCVTCSAHRIILAFSRFSFEHSCEYVCMF